MVRGAQRASAVCDLLCEFLEALVHQVLFARGLYCAASFEDRRLYDTFVHKNRHPGVVQYINSVVLNLKASLEADDLKSFFIVFYDSLSVPIERVVLDFEKLKLDQLGPEDGKDLDTIFRILLRNITSQNAILKKLPEGASFEIVASTKSGRLGLDNWCEEIASDVSLPSPALCTHLKSINYGEALGLHLAIMGRS